MPSPCTILFQGCADKYTWNKARLFSGSGPRVGYACRLFAVDCFFLARCCPIPCRSADPSSYTHFNWGFLKLVGLMVISSNALLTLQLQLRGCSVQDNFLPAFPKGKATL